MTRNTIPSTLGEGDFLPGGEHAINVPFAGLQTHLGLLPFPPGETQGVVFPVITNAGGMFVIAGNCQSSARPIVVWHDGAWHDDTRSAVGNKSCIFDNHGVLTVNQGEAGSQGYRYVTPSNKLVKCDDTHGPTYDVSKWTDLSVNQDRTLLVGQAHWTNAVVVWDGALVDGVMTGVHRVIEAVAGNWITAHRVGDLCSITYATASYAALVTALEAELRALPIIEKPSEPPVTEPPPIDETEPPPSTEPPEPEPIPPQPEPIPPPSGGTSMHAVGYTDINYQGHSQEFPGNAYNLAEQGIDKQLSSFKVPEGVAVTLYADAQHGGASLVLTEDTPDLRKFPGPGADGTWNDAASSVGIGVPAAPPVRLMREGKYIEAIGKRVMAVTSPSDAGLVVLTEHPADEDGDIRFDARFTKQNVQLSIGEDGELQQRPAGTFDAYEQLFCTTQPDETSILYRHNGTRVCGEPLLIEEVA